MEAGYSDILEEEENAQEIADREDEEERQLQRKERKHKKYMRMIKLGFKGLLADVSTSELSDEDDY